jgi:hypothetical protein
MRFHRHILGVVASSRDNIVEEEKRFPTCECLRVNILIQLANAVVFDGDLQDSIIIVKQQLACRTRR